MYNSSKLAAEPTSPDPDLELGLVEILHVVSDEPIEQVADQRLENHDRKLRDGPKYRLTVSFPLISGSADDRYSRLTASELDCSAWSISSVCA